MACALKNVADLSMLVFILAKRLVMGKLLVLLVLHNAKYVVTIRNVQSVATSPALPAPKRHACRHVLTPNAHCRVRLLVTMFLAPAAVIRSWTVGINVHLFVEKFVRTRDSVKFAQQRTSGALQSTFLKAFSMEILILIIPLAFFRHVGISSH